MYENFQKLLDSNRVTAYKVAKATGISTASLSDWKMGRSTPKADKLQKIADFFGVSMEELMTGKPPEIEKTPSQSAGGDIESQLSILLDSNTFMLDGKVASPEAAQYLKESFEAVIAHAKRMNEKKD